jgi:hypothetical protein
MCLIYFDWIKKFVIFHRQFLSGSHMLGSQLGNFLILILFKQLLSDKIFLGQEKN